MSFGCAGKILSVDLTTGRFQEEPVPEKIQRDYVGGQGVAVRLLYERMRAGVDPLGPESHLGFATGLLTATPSPSSGRFMVVGKSPLTGTWAEANSGGTFGPLLKEAGYDAVFFRGLSPEPVYLLIRGGKPDLRSAAGLWGLDTYDTEDRIRAETGDPSVVAAAIGPSGESRSLLAGIVNEKGRTAARSGLGAVMGSKNLKAVAVNGEGRRVEVGDRARLKAACGRYLDAVRAAEFNKNLGAGGTAGGTSFLVSIGDSPIQNWRRTGLDAMPTVTNLDSANVAKYRTKGYACRACPIRCGAILEQKEGPFAIAAHIHRPEYETVAAFGGLCLNDNMEAVIRANDICNRFGVDTINTGSTVAFAMECFEKGLITAKETGGLDLAWGRAEAVVALTEKIVRREGIGDVLADGVGKAAERIGRGAEEFAIAVLGQSLPFHDPRMSPSLAVSEICDANPAHHMDCGVTAQMQMGAAIDADPLFRVPAVDVFRDFDKMGPVHALGAKYHQLFNAAGLCALYTVGSAAPLADLVGGAAGWDFGWDEALEAGYRILTLRQAFNAREGLTPDRFRFPRRIREELLPVGPWAGKRIDFEALRRGFFEEAGWDLGSGWPSRSVVRRLGLEELIPG